MLVKGVPVLLLVAVVSVPVLTTVSVPWDTEVDCCSAVSDINAA